jgi:WS/DGAT/MGAT family acyltransferase
VNHSCRLRAKLPLNKVQARRQPSADGGAKGRSQSWRSTINTRRLNPLDASWLFVEHRNTPMHVAGLIPFSPPADAPPDFLRNLIAELRTTPKVTSPWNLRLRNPRLKTLVPAWVEDQHIDLDYHIRHSALPSPGGERELGVLVSRLHSQPIDFHRPPWELHFIEGLEGGRFAIYLKIHHSLIDGIAAVRLLQRTMSTRPDDPERPLFLAAEAPAPHERPTAMMSSAWPELLDMLMAGVRKQVNSAREVARAIGELSRAARGENKALTPPFRGPRSVLNGRIRSARRLATQQYSVQRLKTLAAAANCSLNDIVLAICAGGLRRFLLEANALPGTSLTAGCPVNVRAKDDQSTGNAISFIVVNLGTDIADPVLRLKAIRASAQAAKSHLQSLPKHALTQYTMLLMAPFMLQLITGRGGRTRPMFNLTISNVPGPEQPMYLRGARMEASYPVSLVSHGQALNITCQSYAGTLNFGFVGDRDTVPHLQRLAVYTGDALKELEQALLQTGESAPASPAKRSRSQPKKSKSTRTAKQTAPAPE